MIFHAGIKFNVFYIKTVLHLRIDKPALIYYNLYV